MGTPTPGRFDRGFAILFDSAGFAIHTGTEDRGAILAVLLGCGGPEGAALTFGPVQQRDGR